MRRIGSALGVCFMLALAVLAPRADALPIAPDPVAPVPGIPQPCRPTHPWPGDDAPLSEVKRQFEEAFGVGITGPLWTSRYRPSIRILWDTFDALSCTDYLQVITDKAPSIRVNAAPIRGYAWGDWSLTRPNHVTLDFAKFELALDAGDQGRLVRLIVHEFAHAWNSDRFSNPQYWQDFQALRNREGNFSDYAGSKTTEIFADVVGYYVGRCALNNPYDSSEYDAYYEFVQDSIFDGREFGPAPGEATNCELPADKAQMPLPGQTTAPAWVVDVSQD